MTRFPAGRRGPRSGEGVLEGKNRKETQSRAGRLSAVRLAAECHIGAWPRTPYGPSRGSEGGRREIFESYSSCTLPAPPFGGCATTFLHGKASHTILRSLSLPYESCSLATPLRGGTMGAGLLSQFVFMAVTPENLHNRPYGRSPTVKVLGRKAAIIIAPEGRHHNPLNLRLREPSTLTPAGRVKKGRETAPL